MAAVTSPLRAFKVCLFALFFCILSTLTQAEPSQQAASVKWPAVRSAIVKDDAIEAHVLALVSSMSLKEKVGQIVQPQITNVSPAEVTKYHLGSVLSAGGSYPASRHGDIITWVAAANQFYQASIKHPNKRSAIPIIWGVDAVHGHNNLVGATIFPHNIGLGATRNPTLMRAIGEVTAREVSVTGLNWTFAPTVAVARNQRWGRTYESYSEKPEIVALLAGAMVAGLQGHPSRGDLFAADKVIATAKHFIGDGGTYNGIDQGNTKLDETSLRDLHIQGFVAALNAGAQTIMASFNSWNGSKVHGDHYLLTEVLKNQMGFDGFVIGDWNGHEQVDGCSAKSCPQAINAGIDMIMVPDDWRAFYKNTVRQVKNGEISAARLDDAVTRILRVKLRAGMFSDNGHPLKNPFSGRSQIIGHPKHRAVARQAVRESLVLLKNNDSLLPLSPSSRILVAGEGADNLVMQSGGWTITWQGDKSSNDDFPGATSILTAINSTVLKAGGHAVYHPRGKYSLKPDVAIVILGEQAYAEGKGDIENLAFKTRDFDILEQLHRDGIPTVSIMLSGRPLWVTPLINRSTAFIAAWLPGSEGQGITDVIFSDDSAGIVHDFQGKLAFSWPKLPDQVPHNVGDQDYQPLFPFGYGLNYDQTTQLPWLNEQ